MKTKMISAIALVLLSAVGASAQIKKSAKHAPAVETSKPISPYMRDVGILYLEAIDDLSKDCDVTLSDQCSTALKDSSATFRRIEDRVNITLSESVRPSGDQPFWTLLQNAKWAQQLSLGSQYNFLFALDHPALSSPEAVARDKTNAGIFIEPMGYCYAFARQDALSGTFETDGGCGDKFNAAVAARLVADASARKQ